MILNERKKNVFIIFSLIISSLFFVSFIFSDILETTRDGMTFWDALFGGRLRDFYIMNENVKISDRFGVSGAAIYDFPVYFVFAVWNLPLWIYEKLTGVYALDHLWGLLWAKSISIPFLAGIYLVMNRIGKRVAGKIYSKELALLMFDSSALLFVPVLIMGQYDSLCLLFILLGVEAYIEENEKKFIFWFAIAAAFKLFAFFVFIPLLLLKEKRLMHILMKFFGGCSFLLFWKIMQKLFFRVSEIGTEYLSGHLLTFIFQSQIGFAYYSSSIFIMFFVGICMYCYFKAPIEKEKIGIWALYVSFLGLSSFFVASLTHPQWSILLLPFTILLVLCRREEERKTGMWISTIFTVGLLVSEVIAYHWVFNIKTSAYMLAGKLFYDGTRDMNYSIRNLIESKLTGFDINYLNLIGGGIFVAGIFFFLYWANPNTDKRKFVQLECSEWHIIVTRKAVLLVVAVLLLLLMIL